MGLLTDIAGGAIQELSKSFGVTRLTPPNQAVAKEAGEGPGWNLGGGLAVALRSFNSYNSKSEQLNAYMDWVYGAVRAIAEDAASTDLQLYVNRGSTKNATLHSKMIYSRKWAREYGRKQIDITYVNKMGRTVKATVAQLEEIENHKLLDLLHKPNPAQTKNEFLEFTFTNLELTGESFWLKERNNLGVVIGLWPLNPSKMEHKVKDGRLVGWVYHNNGKRIPIEPTEIVQHKYTDPTNMWRGMGVVKAAARAIDTDTQSADYNRRFFANNGRIDAALQTKDELSNESFERMKQEWNDIYGGVYNAHKIAILEGGLEYKPLAITQKEMDFLESRKFNRDQILALFRVSATILGISENVNRSNAEAGEAVFAKRVLLPKLERLTSNITENLAPDFDSKLIVSFANPVPEDKEFILKERESSINKYRTINEIRAELGDEPLAGGDELYVPINSVPLSFAAATDTGSGGDDSTVNNSLRGKKKVLKRKSLYNTDDERIKIGEAIAARVDKAARSYEKKFVKATRGEFNRQKKEVLDNIERLYTPKSFKTKGIEDLMFNRQTARDRLYAALIPPYKGQVQTAGDQASILIGLDGIDMEDPHVTNYFNSHVNKVSKVVNDETEKQLRATLAIGINEGESIEELAARVTNVYGAAAGFRAERIARTESIHAGGFASNEAWRQSGEVDAKEWYTTQDELVCDYCASMDGTKIGLGDTYFDKGDELEVSGANPLKLSYEDIEHPPLHSNCRCIELPILS